MYLTIVVLSVLLAFARADFSPVSTAKAIEHLNGTRIVGGHDAKIGEFPHIVLLMCIAPDETAWTSFCGGSIIHPQWVLTAAHCVKSYHQECPENYQFHIAAGRHEFEGYNSQPNEQYVKVSKYVVHEKYVYAGEISADDVALLKLEKPVRMNKFVRPISLPPPYFEAQGKAVAAGWGLNNFEATTFPEVLQTVEMEIIDLATCNASIMSIDPASAAVLQVTNMCTGPLTGGVSTCGGDSGGPIMGKFAGLDVLIGVVSWGFRPCGMENGPSVHAKVSNYVYWIMRNMAMN